MEEHGGDKYYHRDTESTELGFINSISEIP
jgi:hypothetical protein